MGFISRATWSYGRAWSRAIKRHGRSSNEPILNDKFLNFLQSKSDKHGDKKLEKRIQKEQKILDMASEIQDRRDKLASGLPGDIGENKTRRVFRF